MLLICLKLSKQNFLIELEAPISLEWIHISPQRVGSSNIEDSPCREVDALVLLNLFCRDSKSSLLCGVLVLRGDANSDVMLVN
ncbi:hypothetical protein TNCV_3831401 [Trichonephila clavipes]|nr:hypothetical protein TNCV_3831401 [Trichonephila clavipes]